MLSRVSTSAKKAQEGSSRKKRIFITWFMAIIMVSSIGGFIISYNSDSSVKLDYNKFKIESTKSGYLIHINDGKAFSTINHPTSLETIKVESEVWDLLKSSRVLGITYNQSDEHAQSFASAQFMLDRALPVASRIFVQRGLFDASGTNLMNLTCKDATSQFPVVLLLVGDDTTAHLQGSCVLVSGISGPDVERVADRIIFGLAGVMPRGS